MRALAACIVALGLFAAPAMAGAGGAAENASPAVPKPNRAAPNSGSPAAAPATESEVQQLRDLLAAQAKQLREQQQKMQLMEQQLKASGTNRENLEASASAPAAVTPAAASATPTASLSATPAITPVKPAAAAQGGKEPKLGPLATQKIKLGVTLFGDYAFYTDTGFGPQFITQINQPGPGNAHFNSFDITRTYLNFFYMPDKAITIRVTPNIYRQVDGTAGSIGNGSGAVIGGSDNGNLTFRLKYAYVDFNTLFSNSEAFKKDKLTIGSTTIPLVDWEEGLYGYRYTSLVPWNYLSLSSTYVGVKLHGPIEFGGKEFLDYDLGVFNSTSFHHIEQSADKEVMGRLTFYPFGTTKDRTGFGATIFEDYGYSNHTPDTSNHALDRFAAIVFYQTHSKSAQIAGEFDVGRNALSTGNLFSGAKPSGAAPYDVFNGVAGSILAGDRTRQLGFDFFGHIKLGDSPFALFGLFQYMQPNTNYDYVSNGYTADPIDFTRTVGGISYAYNSHLDFALQDSNFHYLHPQGLVGANDTNAVFLNFQFNY